jgi:hypothetical protein
MLTLAPGPEAQLIELAGVLDPERWMLVGGLMVHLHAHLAGVSHQRPTNDVDIVLLPRPGAYPGAATALAQIGYLPHESLDHTAPFHRFVRGSEQIDVMSSDDRVRYRGRRVLQVPGAKSAAKRASSIEIAPGVSIQLPDLASALSLKGAALHTDGAGRPRHTQDGITLFACAAGQELSLSRSMRANINGLISALESPAYWLSVPAAVRLRAVRGIQKVRPEWALPAEVQGGGRARPSRPKGRSDA